LQDDPLSAGGCDGSFGHRRMFQCPSDRGIFAPLTDVVKFDDFMFVNPGRELSIGPITIALSF
jgi:hypothetical protein